MSRITVVACHRGAPTECSWPSSRATKIDPGSGWQSAGAASKQTMELSASATYPAQVVFSPSTFRGAHRLSAGLNRSQYAGGRRIGAHTPALDGAALPPEQHDFDCRERQTCGTIPRGPCVAVRMRAMRPCSITSRGADRLARLLAPATGEGGCRRVLRQAEVASAEAGSQ